MVDVQTYVVREMGLVDEGWMHLISKNKYYVSLTNEVVVEEDDFPTDIPEKPLHQYPAARILIEGRERWALFAQELNARTLLCAFRERHRWLEVFQFEVCAGFCLFLFTLFFLLLLFFHMSESRVAQQILEKYTVPKQVRIPRRMMQPSTSVVERTPTPDDNPVQTRRASELDPADDSDDDMDLIVLKCKRICENAACKAVRMSASRAELQ